MYEANVDDVGYRIVAVYTPVREDGVEGQPVSASTDPIAVGKYYYYYCAFEFRWMWNLVCIFFFAYLYPEDKCHLILEIDILSEPDVLKEVKQKLDLGSVKFEVSLRFTVISFMFH